MPLFKKGNSANFSDGKEKEKKSKDKNSAGSSNKFTSTPPVATKSSHTPPQERPENQPKQQTNAHTNQPAKSKPSRPEEVPGRSLPPPPPEPAAAPPRFVFYCQLAHGSPTAKVEGFTNVKELYQKIADAFKVNAPDILFCTLNTYRVDMERLLGGQIGLDDFIFAHMKGSSKIVEVYKDQPALGLTITDNGAGCAFIKRIKEGSLADKSPQICVGDHVEYINGNFVVGSRHFDVARMLREVDVQGTITLHLVEPLRGFGGIGPRTASKGGQGNPIDEPDKVQNKVGTGKATLRLKAKGPPVLEEVEASSWDMLATKKVDDLLESFLGIRDEELANTLVDLSKDKANPSTFAMAVDENFSDFEFPDDFIFDIWGLINDAKSGRI